MSDRPVSKVVKAPPGPLGIKVKSLEKGIGLEILTVDPKSPLLTKLYPGDWIVSLDADDVANVADLTVKSDRDRVLGVLTVQDQQRIQTENVHDALGPPTPLLEYTVQPVGTPLGILLDEKHSVIQICDRSPMEGLLMKHDRICAINGVGVSNLDMTQLSTYLGCLQENNETITLKVERGAMQKNQVKLLQNIKEPDTIPAKVEPTTTPPQQQSDVHANDPHQTTTNNVNWTHSFLSPQQGFERNAKIRVAQRKIYPAMAGYGVSLGTDDESSKLRQTLLAELIMWNEKHNFEQEFNYQGRRSRLFWVPCGHGPTLFDDMPINQVLQACRQSLMFDETVHAIVKYFGFFSYEKGVELILTYFAHTQPKEYEKFSSAAEHILEDNKSQKKRSVAANDKGRKKKIKIDPENDIQNEEEKKQEGQRSEEDEAGPVVLPDDYKDYDGSGDLRWNLRYMDLIRFKKDNGHCLVPMKDVPLGNWVAWQRRCKKTNDAELTDRREKLLEDLGFVWEATHANRKPRIEAGDPRINRALATRIVFRQQFSDRQVFLLSGFSVEEMKEVRNPANPGRNGLKILRKRLDGRLKAFTTRVKKEKEGVQNLPKLKTILAVQELIATLQNTENPDRYIHVYGEENAKLLQDFLSGAVSIEDIFGKTRIRRRKTIEQTRNGNDNMRLRDGLNGKKPGDDGGEETGYDDDGIEEEDNDHEDENHSDEIPAEVPSTGQSHGAVAQNVDLIAAETPTAIEQV